MQNVKLLASVNTIVDMENFQYLLQLALQKLVPNQALVLAAIVY